MYFVTICTADRECLFGEVVDGTIVLNNIGRVVEQQIYAIGLVVDCFVVMPNHIHLLLAMMDDGVEGAKHPRTDEIGDVGIGNAGIGAKHSRTDVIPSQGSVSANAWPLRSEGWLRGTRGGSVGAIVQNLKSVTSRKTNTLRKTHGAKIWQRDFYDRIVRDGEELDRVRQYITLNPLNWSEDKDNPSNRE
jgi:REP element-mobilizing transposase RayT